MFKADQSECLVDARARISIVRLNDQFNMFNYAWPSTRLKENLSQMASEYIFLSTSVSNLEHQNVWNTLKKARALGLQKTGSVCYFRLISQIILSSNETQKCNVLIVSLYFWNKHCWRTFCDISEIFLKCDPGLTIYTRLTESKWIYRQLLTVYRVLLPSETFVIWANGLNSSTKKVS